MQIAIVGLASSGKTTVFNTLTRGHAETGGYGGVTLNVGVVKVPAPSAERTVIEGDAGRDDDFQASVERDLANLPVLEETDDDRSHRQ